MGALKLTTPQHDYMSFILTSFHIPIPIPDFIYRMLSPEGNYERQLYEWIIQLYSKGKTKEQALEIIYEARDYFFIRKTPIECIPVTPTASLQKILLHRLALHPSYQRLRPVNQFIVQDRFKRLMQMENAIALVKQVQESKAPFAAIEKIITAMIKGNTLLVSLKNNSKTSIS